MHCSAFSLTLHEIFSKYGSKSAQSLSFFIDYFRILHNALPSHPMSTLVPETLYPPKKKPALSIHSLESMWWLEKGRVSFPTAMPLPCTSKNQLMMEPNQPRTSTWLQVAAVSMNIHTAFICSTVCRHQHNLLPCQDH